MYLNPQTPAASGTRSNVLRQYWILDPLADPRSPCFKSWISKLGHWILDIKKPQRTGS